MNWPISGVFFLKMAFSVISDERFFMIPTKILTVFNPFVPNARCLQGVEQRVH